MTSLSNKKKIYIIFVLFLFLHIIIFRDVIFAIPDILQGESVVVREELIPFFDFNSQFFDQLEGGLSPLTSTDEIRVSYSFWTSWMRYYAILPFALVLLNTLSAFILFLATYLLTREFFKKANQFVFLSSLLASTVIHFIILYSKVTHFYTLVFGFSLFALAISLTLREFFYRDSFSLKQSVLISGLVLFNPAIHYHILYYLVFVLSIIGLSFLKFSKATTIKALKYFLSILLISLVPYVVFLLYVLSHNTTNVQNSIPVDYWSIFYSSNSLSHLFSLDIAAQIDMFFHGSYLIQMPRYLKIILSIITFLPLFFIKTETEKTRRFLIFCYALLLFAIFMSIGYAHLFSFHSVLGYVMEALSNFHGFIVNITEKLITTTVQILRFPHRFTFITLYLTGIILSFSLGMLGKYVKPKVAYLLFPALLLFPFLANTDYRSVILTGNFNSFLEPMEIPNDLLEIKEIMEANPGKMIVLPTLESGRELLINGTRYGFIDKFLIYYLDSETFYYGTGAQAENKILSSFIYQSMMNKENSWEQVLSKSIGIKYILLPKTAGREVGQVFLPEVDNQIRESLSNSDLYKKIYDGVSFNLYKISNAVTADKNLLIDLPIANLDKNLNSIKNESQKIFFPIQIYEFLKNREQKFILTENLERTYYNILIGTKTVNQIFPSSQMVPFTDKLISSTFYTNTPLSITILWNAKNPSNYLKRAVPDLINLNSSQFIATTDPNYPISFSLNSSKEDYTAFLKASFPEDIIEAQIDKRKVIFRKIKSNLEPLDENGFTYFKSTEKIKVDDGIVNFFANPTSALIVESLILVPKELEYINNNEIIGSKNIQFSKTKNKLIYKFEYTNDTSY